MLRLWILCLALAAGFVGGSLAEAENKEDTVFLDEGDGDFDPMPSVEPGNPVSRAPEKVDSPAVEPTSAKLQVPTKEVEDQPDAKAESAPAPRVRAGHNPKIGKKDTPAKAKKSAKGDAGIYVTTKSVCPIRREPASESDEIAKTKAPRKIWVQKVDEKWVRAYVKSGDPGYISTDCFEP
jgi:hypothetical protein